jgi:hypothetical protein
LFRSYTLVPFEFYAHLAAVIRPSKWHAFLSSLASAYLRQTPSPRDKKKELYCASQTIGVMDRDVLNSWKEIANYMGRGIRTVQRWEQELGLPVRRPRGKNRSAVIALKVDLDRWLQDTPQGAAGRKSSQRIDHLQLHRNTELLKQRTAELMAQSQKLQARIAESMALAAALKAKHPALAQPVHTLYVPPPRNRPHVNRNFVH